MEEGRPGDPLYRRELTPEEAFIVTAATGEDRGAQLAEAMAERDRWFFAASMRLVEPGQPFDPAALEAAAAAAGRRSLGGTGDADAAPD